GAIRVHASRCTVFLALRLGGIRAHSCWLGRIRPSRPGGATGGTQHPTPNTASPCALSRSGTVCAKAASRACQRRTSCAAHSSTVEARANPQFCPLAAQRLSGRGPSVLAFEWGGKVAKGELVAFAQALLRKGEVGRTRKFAGRAASASPTQRHLVPDRGAP
ncbi:uncharacterized protein PHACADRAFT_207464, partial [Phanerochaete carnosa HHB-10118-sp]